jgi:uncharacterized protein
VSAPFTEFTFDVGAHGTVSGAIYRAPTPLHATLILAHGAGVPRTHPFMTDMAARLASKGVDVVTFNFLYSEAGRKMPDRVELLEACWRAAIATVRARGGLPTERLFIGGKSMGGRIGARIAGASDGLVLSGLVLLGYPLHPPGKPLAIRSELLEVKLPMLVVQGTRDELGTPAEVARVLKRGGPPFALHVVDEGDHSFALPKARGEAAQERAFDEIASAIAAFVGGAASPRVAPSKRRKKKP